MKVLLWHIRLDVNQEHVFWFLLQWFRLNKSLLESTLFSCLLFRLYANIAFLQP
jgi:hypothetical protein